MFDKLQDAYAKYYSKKCKQFVMKIYKLCDSRGHQYNMTVYFGIDRKHVTATVTATHTSVAEVIENMVYDTANICS
jgi:hypothetical protein